MKKHFIPLTALALMALVSCGGGNNPSSSASSGTSQSASSSQTTQASDPSSEKSSESVSEKSSEETSASDSESSTESGSESSSESSSETVDYAVAISNKNALTAEWHLGEADRAVEFDLAPRTNITQAIADGVLTIVSSNPEVVQVLGRNLHAAGEGTATITVTYGDATDSVEITVLAMLGEPAFEQKNLTAVMGVEDLVTSGSNKYSKVAFLTQVKVAVIGSKKDGSGVADKYGNLYVTDPSIENDAELVQVYGASATFTALSHQNDGYYKFVNPQDYLKNDATKDIKVGDILDVIAIRADYNTTKEISIVIRSVNGAPVANREVASGDVAGFELTDNEKKLFYKVSGKIDGWKDANTTDGTKYGNFFIKTEGSNNPVYVYGATASANAISFNEDGSLRFTNPKDFLTNEATKDLKIGDEVTLIGFRCDYNGTVELNGIIVTNAEPTPVVPAKTSLENLANGDTVDIPELTVTAVSDKGFAVTDGTRGAYVYVGSVPTVKVNNVIALKGNVEEYHGYLQITSPTVMVLEDKTPKVANATILTAEGATALKTASGLEAAKLYKWRAKATKDGNFWLFNIDGSDTKLEPVNVPESFGLVEGNTYDVEAYFTAYDTKYNFAQFLLVSATKVEGEEPPVVEAKTSLSELDADGLDVELSEVTVIAINKKGFAVTDGTDYMYVYANKDPGVAVGDVISLKGKTASFNGIHQIGSPEVTKLENKTPKVVNPTALTPEILNAFPEATNYRVGNVYTWKTTAGKAGNYLTLPVLGSEVVVEPTQLLADISIEEGKNYTITAYYNGYESKNNYAQFTVVLAEPLEVTPTHTWQIIGNRPYTGNWDTAKATEFTFNPVSNKHTLSITVEKGAAFKVISDRNWDDELANELIAKIGDESILKAEGNDNNPTAQKAGTFTFSVAEDIFQLENKADGVEASFTESNRAHSWNMIGSADIIGGTSWNLEKAALFDYDETTHKHTLEISLPVGTRFKVVADRSWGVKELGADLITKLNDETVLAAGENNDPTIKKEGVLTIVIDDDILTKENVADGFTMSFKGEGEPEPVVKKDVINYDAAGVKGSAYTDWTYTSSNGVGYSGNSGGGNTNKENLQLRSKNSNSGVVITKNDDGLVASKVIVVWNTANSNGDTATLDVYGKDSAYAAASDLYNSNNSGTELAKLAFAKRDTETNACEFDLSGLDTNYSFLGFRSENGTCYIESITVVWAE